MTEKSCGAVLYRITQGTRQYLAILNRSHRHWGFPKGHVEANETEEQTARREVREETGLIFDLIPGFRHAVAYTMSNGKRKEVVYFLGRAMDLLPVRQEEEISDIRWMDANELMEQLYFETDRQTLLAAEQHLQNAR